MRREKGEQAFFAPRVQSKRKKSMEIISRPSENEEIRNQRQVMVDGLKTLGAIQTPPVEEAFRAIPRHLFVPEAQTQRAYTDTHIVTRERDGKALSSSSMPSL